MCSTRVIVSCRKGSKRAVLSKECVLQVLWGAWGGGVLGERVMTFLSCSGSE